MLFKLSKKSNIRKGTILTKHGEIKTPFFMPVGTLGNVKGVAPWELKKLGAQIILCNAYHLYLRPGEKTIKDLKGIHKYIGWDRAILTDSGGYQVFSLSERKYNDQLSMINFQKVRNSIRPTGKTSPKRREVERSDQKSLVKISTNGVEFTSHLDGSRHFFTPEKVIQIQLDLGVDIIMPLDVCPSGEASSDEQKNAVNLTCKWAKQSREYFDKQMAKLSNYQNNNTKTHKHLQPTSYFLQADSYKLQANRPGLFGIVQGGLNEKLRRECTKRIVDIGFDGYAVGGLAVDKKSRNMWQTVKLMGEILPCDKPRYLMGVGTPDDILKATNLGMDMFDCVLPTRLARHGSVYINSEKLKSQKSKENRNNNYQLINLLNSKYRRDAKVIDDKCRCATCTSELSRSYLSHLIREKEILGASLLSIHNIYVYMELMRKLRAERNF